jgi:hypothetical protein
MLLRYVLLRALELAENPGCVGVLVDAKPSAVGYYRSFGFEAEPAVEGESTAHPPCVPMFMDLETVRKASGG